ncbi:MAG: hypothetical protein K0S74_263 [Chlamydiales bacterium]|jgi:NitT/TauT family transport system substrate-binding protein|nr:hypothetical protein [Chlamydiales bacterium]
MGDEDKNRNKDKSVIDSEPSKVSYENLGPFTGLGGNSVFLRLSAILLLVWFIFSTLTSYCNRKQEMSVTKDKGIKTRLLLDWTPNPNHIVLYAGIEQGIFKKYGIDLEILKIHDPADTVPYLAAQQADIALHYSPYTLQALSRGQELRLVGIIIDKPTTSILSLAKNNIHKLEDLNNRIIGYTTGSTSRVYQQILAEKGIFPKEYRKLNFDLITALTAGIVDAVSGCSWNIEPHQLKSMGIESSYIKLEELGVPDYYELVVVGHAKLLESVPGLTSNMKLALQEAVDYCRSYPKLAFNDYCKLQPEKTPETISWEKYAWNATLPLLPRSQNFDHKLIQNYIDWQKKYGLLPEGFQIKQNMIAE